MLAAVLADAAGAADCMRAHPRHAFGQRDARQGHGEGVFDGSWLGMTASS